MINLTGKHIPLFFDFLSIYDIFLQRSSEKLILRYDYTGRFKSYWKSRRRYKGSEELMDVVKESREDRSFSYETIFCCTAQGGPYISATDIFPYSKKLTSNSMRNPKVMDVIPSPEGYLWGNWLNIKNKLKSKSLSLCEREITNNSTGDQNNFREAMASFSSRNTCLRGYLNMKNNVSNKMN